jgi:hypothetical protein
MDTQKAEPYFHTMLASVKITAELILKQSPGGETYRTTEGVYAHIHTGIFRRMNMFWF